MKIERPEDENTKNKNIKLISQFQKQMQSYEKEILRLLVECKESPVEDENMVETLQFSKRTS